MLKSYDELYGNTFTPHLEIFENVVTTEELSCFMDNKTVEEIEEVKQNKTVEETSPQCTNIESVKPEYVVTTGLFGKTKVRKIK